MAELDSVISEIIQGCAARGHAVTEALATYMARVIVENDPVRFPPDGELGPGEVVVLIELAVERLCEPDAPAMQTIKMQVGFDSTYVYFEEELAARKRARDEDRRALVRHILAVRPKSGSDYETLTALYRDIYTYVLRVSRGGKPLERPAFGHGPGFLRSREPTAPEENESDPATEREVAAAMESVFPRIGLKSFVQLSSEDKRAQLEELGRIVTGIRLFNRECGKGGAGLARVEDLVTTKVQDLRQILDQESVEQQELCTRYQETLVYCHLRRPDGVSPRQSTRWAQELANRRQYCAYLASLGEDATASGQRVAQRREKFTCELEELKTLIGGRASVPKEQVYPKFDAIASAWFDLDDELRRVETRKEALDELHQYRESYRPTLPATHPVYRAARVEGSDDKTSLDTQADMAEAIVAADSTTATASSSRPTRAAEDALPSSDGPVRLSIETTPEFMQLPLEYQGFCGWTVANRRGLLLPGKPALGVVKYQGKCFVFAHAVALEAFLDRPDDVQRGIVSVATENPELVHLLRLQDQYPGTSVAKVLAQRCHRRKGDATDRDSAEARSVDAATGTPTHFVEKHIDHDYEWNEWALRRRALRVTRIKNNCVTHSMQTDESHFRRDTTTQVYLPRIAATQTTRDNASSPPVQIQYLAGLRGQSGSTAFAKGAKKKQPGIVTLSYEF